MVVPEINHWASQEWMLENTVDESLEERSVNSSEKSTKTVKRLSTQFKNETK